MKCTNCSAETTWLEVVGGDIVCRKCLNKHQSMGLALRTSADSFKFLVKKLGLKNYKEYMKVKDEDIKQFVNINKFK